jgi:hypothetical protein
LSSTATLAVATSRTSSSFSTSADNIGWSWAIIRARWAKAPLLPLPNDQTEGLQNAPDLPVDLDPDVDEPTANAEQRHSFMGSEALDLNLLEPTRTHHLGEPPRVVTIGFDGAN